MVTIGVNQYLTNKALYKHKYLDKTKELYKYTGRCDNENQFSIIEAVM